MYLLYHAFVNVMRYVDAFSNSWDAIFDYLSFLILIIGYIFAKLFNFKI